MFQLAPLLSCGARLCGLAAALVLVACASLPAPSAGPVAAAASAKLPVPASAGLSAGERVWAVTADHQLIQFHASLPQKVLQRRPVSGLPAGDALVGIDYRVARGVLYALSAGGRLYALDTASGTLSPVGQGPAAALSGERLGFDFNPAADRIRVVSDSGQNQRLHPDTGAVVDADPSVPGVQIDPPLAYAPGDVHAGRAPQVAAAAYTYNPRDDKLTTNYAIDLALGTLVTQGTVEGVAPAVSPNTGRLFTVGSLGLGPLADAAFDIADTNNKALVAARSHGGDPTRLYQVDLNTGRARLLGTVAGGDALRGMAIEP